MYKDNSWSQNPLEKRAEIADQHWTRANFKTLVLTSDLAGHSAVHGTLSSLRWVMQVAHTGNSLPDEDRSNSLGIALHGTTFDLFIFSAALDEHFSLDLKETIAKLEHLS